MDRRKKNPVLWRGPGFAIAFVLLLAQAAAARTELVQWRHATPTLVTGFEVQWGTAAGSFTNQVTVNPSPDAQGLYNQSVTVGDTQTLYVVVRALGTNGPSPFSREGVAPPPATSEEDGGSIPEDPSALLYQGFETSSVSSAVSGWFDTGANNSLAEDDSLFSVVQQGNNRALTTTSTGINIHSHYLAGGSSSWSSYELTGRMKKTHSDGGIGATAYSRFPSQDAYYRLRQFNSDPFELNMHPDAASMTCTSDVTGVVPSVNVWYEFRLQVVPTGSSNAVRAKVWRQGSSEPSVWQAECEDRASIRPSGGAVGIWAMSAGAKYWDNLQVRSVAGGEPPVLPPPPPPEEEPEALGQPGQPFITQ